MGYFNLTKIGIAVALLVFAFASCTSNPEGEISQTEQETQGSNMAEQLPEMPSATPQEAAQIQTSEDEKIITVTGTVEGGMDGMIISTDDGAYAVEGQDLSDMAGMTVQITGALKESEGLRTIEVTDVVIVK